MRRNVINTRVKIYPVCYRCAVNMMDKVMTSHGRIYEVGPDGPSRFDDRLQRLAQTEGTIITGLYAQLVSPSNSVRS